MVKADAEKVARLPKWARDHIAVLERDLSHAEGLLAVKGDVTATNVLVRRPARLEYEALQRDSEVLFVTGLNGAYPIGVRVRIGPDKRIIVNADRSIAVRPSGANQVTVEHEGSSNG